MTMSDGVEVHVRKPDGTLLDYFNTNARDLAVRRINRCLGPFPDAEITIAGPAELVERVQKEVGIS